MRFSDGEGSELFRQLIDAAPDAMVVMGEDGTIELVNIQAEALFGYARNELLGQPIEVLVPERFREAHVGHRSKFVASPKSRPMGSGLELFGRRKDGSEFPIEISLSPLKTESGLLVSSAIRDITVRRRAEQKFRGLLEAAPDAIVIVDLEGRIVLVNAQTERLFGYPRAQLLGERVEMLVPKRLRAQHQVHRTSYSKTPKARGMGADFELFGVRKDGSEFPVEISLSPLETDEGALISSAIRDITQRKEVESAARLASDRLLSAVESIHGMLALYDAQDRLVLCNSAWREVFSRRMEGPLVGLTHAELVDGCLATELLDLSDESRTEFRARWLAYHQSPVGVLDIRTRDGQSLRLTERRTLEGGIVSTIWDITDDVMHETELKKAHALAEAASSAKSEFLSSMSHELRTPLNSILGFAQLLQRDKKAPLTEAQKEKLEYVLKGGEHLLRLIDDILDLSRIEAGRVTVSPEPVGVAEVFAEVKATLEPMASRAGITFTVEPVPAELSQVIADRTRFSQILINFGSNSLKYGRKGGRATVAAAPSTDGFVRISVSDDGVGIPADKQDKIFQPFHRAGQETGSIEGTGIGLAITKRLAELMAGSVGFESTPGQGSVFWIDLPALDAQSGAARSTPPPLGAATFPSGGEQGAAYSVVYIEDNPSNIAFMQGLVGELERVSLVCAPTAEVGIEIVRAHRPDVVIMDINLPGMSGYEATRKLQEWPETKDIPVIALTAAAMAGDRKRADEVAFFRYLTKPVKVAELMETLETLFSRPRRPRTPTPSAP
jgi:PAS domain S-box-containing protein